MAHRILLVDDDVELVELLADYLQRDGFDLGWACNGAEGVRAVQSGQFDLVVLDVMMPVMSGLDALRHIRASSDLPVIMHSARGDDADRILGLELGADDYVPKPCSPRELSARIRAILKRTALAPRTSTAREQLVLGTLIVTPSQRRAQLNGRDMALTSTEYNLLELLLRHTGHHVSKPQLSLGALARPFSRFDRSIDVHVSHLRQKLAEAGADSPRIQTVVRKGYLLSL